MSLYLFPPQTFLKGIGGPPDYPPRRRRIIGGESIGACLPAGRGSGRWSPPRVARQNRPISAFLDVVAERPENRRSLQETFLGCGLREGKGAARITAQTKPRP